MAGVLRVLVLYIAIQMSMFPTMADSAADTVRVKNIVFEMGSGASQVLPSLGNVFRVLLPSMT